ncbi:MAG: hypothetical protein JXR51_00500 [Bacteroidales bacterium]|nr:hypothetical protein [Bacteroidales bacterium]MBN2755620.1 hypothetical protein [Bacteroidales bacterium]
MKKFLFFLLAISIILFVNYIIISLIGCIAGACGAGSDFYCNFFCKFAVFLIIASILIPIGIASYKSVKIKT